MRKYFILLIGLCAWFIAANAQATSPQSVVLQKTKEFAEYPPSVICADFTTGEILYESNADLVRPPASLVKMMLMLLVAEGLAVGKYSPNQIITVSEGAQHMGGTQLALKAGEQVPLYKLMYAIAVLSANDAAYAVAEALFGSVSNAVDAMNARGRQLGMTQTHYTSVHGLPPGTERDFDVTTARDQLILARECLNHDTIREWARQKFVQIKPDQPRVTATNDLLNTLPGCDGLKTGYIRAAGFCVAGTIQRENVRLVAIILGCKNKAERRHTAVSLFEQCFARYERICPVQAHTPIGTPVYTHHPRIQRLPLYAASDICLLVRPEDKPRLETVIVAPKELLPPITPGSVVGEVRIEKNAQVLGRAPLVVAPDVEVQAWQLQFKDGVARWQGTVPDGIRN